MRREDLPALERSTREARFLVENIEGCKMFLQYLTLTEGRLSIVQPQIQLWAQNWAAPLGLVIRKIGTGNQFGDPPESCELTAEEVSLFREFIQRRLTRLELALAAVKVKY